MHILLWLVIILLSEIKLHDILNTLTVGSCWYEVEKFNYPRSLGHPSDDLCFCISVFQQIPGTLLVKGSLQLKESPVSGDACFFLDFTGDA
ncbi:unnamed protein product [Ilex paraguariensis]|uniref:Secreted protein n=1 Tax=Ilex paraguariensis TaxID=185542 RepID=A0ABC8UED7_9AQUA